MQYSSLFILCLTNRLRVQNVAVALSNFILVLYAKYISSSYSCDYREQSVFRYEHAYHVQLITNFTLILKSGWHPDFSISVKLVIDECSQLMKCDHCDASSVRYGANVFVKRFKKRSYLYFLHFDVYFYSIIISWLCDQVLDWSINLYAERSSAIIKSNLSLVRHVSLITHECVCTNDYSISVNMAIIYR